MKRCPKCHAEIEETARFCLYCMTSFEEKEALTPIPHRRKRWLMIPAATLAVAVLAAAALALLNGKGPSQNSETEGEVFATSTQSAVTIATTVAAPIATTSTHSTAPLATTTAKPTTAATFTTTTAKPTTAATVVTTSQTTHTTAPLGESAVTYRYRDAQHGDDFSVSASLNGCIVIIGVETVAADGRYVIPATIDGKRVVAIMGTAFSDSAVRDTVKTVVIPQTVKTVWNYAFSGCRNMTDVYFCGEAIFVESQAFAEPAERSGMLTIHCSATCSDREFRYYKHCAASYGAVYMEWNG